MSPRRGATILLVVSERRAHGRRAACYGAGMSLFDPQQGWTERVMLVFGVLGIAVVAFAAGWLAGPALKPWLGG
jgi:hypothetical protein